MFKILVSDSLSDEGLAVLRGRAGIEVDYRPGLGEAELAEAIASADALVVRSGSKVTARVIDSGAKLKVIGRAGIGVDNVDVPAASKRGIVVMNTPTGNSVTTAEHTLSLMMSLARHVPQATASMKGGKWEKKKFEGLELAGKTLGVVGLGTIGRIVADRARGLAMKVIAFDPVLTADRAAALGVELVSLDAIWANADIITVHTPLTPQTTGLINDQTVPKLKKGVLLINCARGGIYDESAVLRGLDSGHIAGAAFDVFVEEPPPKDSPLVKHERVVCTPHLGASTAEAQVRVAVQIVEQVCDFLEKGDIKNPVNVPSLSGEIARKIAPYRTLAERLGRFLAQVESAEGAAFVPTGIDIDCVGEAGEQGVEAIAAAALAGFMQHFLSQPVNAISAPHLAKDRGIAVRQLKSTKGLGPFASQIVVRLTGDAGERVAAGALGSDGSPRLVRWGDFGIEAGLGGIALVVSSLDKPGVIGFLGTALGHHGVNVASVHLGKSSAGQALSVWNLDGELPPKALAEARSSANVLRAVAIEL
jgi:D-3-phosphoglycerate dehydrogenase